MTTDTTEALEREFLAREAWHELDAILDNLPNLNVEDQPEVLRGLAIRGKDLARLLYNGMGYDGLEELSDMRATVYGDADLARREFAKSQVRRLVTDSTETA
ncbi:MAG: hypothetical protein M9951_16910 [Burkholderiaceae bacterium]|nr:hypothetical protein [Burkholderiaceae bacterium]